MFVQSTGDKEPEKRHTHTHTHTHTHHTVTILVGDFCLLNVFITVFY